MNQNIQDLIKDFTKGKTLKEKREMLETITKTRNFINTTNSANNKHCVLINSSRVIKNVFVSLENNNYVVNKTVKECNMEYTRGPKLTEEEKLLLDLSEDTKIFVMYDESIKAVNRRATKLLGFPVGGNVIFFSKTFDLEKEDILKYEK